MTPLLAVASFLIGSETKCNLHPVYFSYRRTSSYVSLGYHEYRHELALIHSAHLVSDINRHLLAPCELHRLIEALFNNSTFAKLVSGLFYLVNISFPDMPVG